jgi:hypothetical protein
MGIGNKLGLASKNQYAIAKEFYLFPLPHSHPNQVKKIAILG